MPTRLQTILNHSDPYSVSRITQEAAAMSDAATKEQVEAPVTEVPAAQEVAAPAAEDVKTDDTATAAAAAPSTVQTVETAKETQNGDAKSEKADGQQQRIQAKNNRKYDPASQPVTDDPVMIRNQVCFFSSPWLRSVCV